MNKALFYNGHPTPDTLSAANCDQFLKDNPELVKHLEVCRHCKNQVDNISPNASRPVLDSSDFPDWPA